MISPVPSSKRRHIMIPNTAPFHTQTPCPRPESPTLPSEKKQSELFQCLEDTIHPESAVFMHQYCPFFHDFSIAAKRFGIKLIPLKSFHTEKSSCGQKLRGPNIWTRDYFVKFLDQSGQKYTYLVGNFRNELTKFWQKEKLDIKKVFPFLIGCPSTMIYDFKTMGLTNTNVVCFSLKDDVDDEIFHDIISLPGSKSMDINPLPLEGGNLFIAAHDHHADVYVIGEDSRAQFAFFQEPFSDFLGRDYEHMNQEVNREKNGFQKWKKDFNRVFSEKKLLPTEDQDQASDFYASQKIKIKRTFEQELNRKVLFIPQVFYHIDLQMMYAGNGLFVIHSFEKTLEFLQKKKIKSSKNLEILI